MSDLPARVEAKIDRHDDGCWIWTAYRNAGGYGIIRNGSKTNVAHRFVYETLVGPIPDGLTLDHLCRNRACVNPDHLEPVTMRENILRGEGVAARAARQTHCIHGHPFAGENLLVYGRRRSCRACDNATKRERSRVWRAKRKATA